MLNAFNNVSLHIFIFQKKRTQNKQKLNNRKILSLMRRNKWVRLRIYTILIKLNLKNKKKPLNI